MGLRHTWPFFWDTLYFIWNSCCFSVAGDDTGLALCANHNPTLRNVPLAALLLKQYQSVSLAFVFSQPSSSFYGFIKSTFSIHRLQGYKATRPGKVVYSCTLQRELYIDKVVQLSCNHHPPQSLMNQNLRSVRKKYRRQCGLKHIKTTKLQVLRSSVDRFTVEDRVVEPGLCDVSPPPCNVSLWMQLKLNI